MGVNADEGGRKEMGVNADGSHILRIHKIKNGSRIKLGDMSSLIITVDHHFNWFQKKMLNWCFGFSVTDYSED